MQACRAGCEAYKTRLAYCRILAQSNFMLLLKHFITKVLEYKVEELNLYALLASYVFLSDESLFM